MNNELLILIISITGISFITCSSLIYIYITEYIPRKYKFYRDKYTKGHPGLQVSEINEEWARYRITHKKPKARNIILIDNPNPNDKNKSFMVTKKIINSKKFRLRPYKNYHLTYRTYKQIEDYLK